MIRQANVSDIPALASVHVISWQAAYHHILPAEILNRLSVKQFETSWQRNFCDAQRVNLVLEVEKQMRGFIAFGNSRDDDITVKAGEIYGLYLVPELWGAGYGRMLWETAAQHLQARFAVATLWVLQNNTRARGFYERAGFECDERVKDISLYGVALPEVRYRKQL